MLVLRTLLFGPAHGHSIAHAIERSSDDALQVEHGSLYPALYRLEGKGLIAGFWGTSESNRKAKYLPPDAGGPRLPDEGTDPVGAARARRLARPRTRDGVRGCACLDSGGDGSATTS